MKNEKRKPVDGAKEFSYHCLWKQKTNRREGQCQTLRPRILNQQEKSHFSSRMRKIKQEDIIPNELVQPNFNIFTINNCILKAIKTEIITTANVTFHCDKVAHCYQHFCLLQVQFSVILHHTISSYDKKRKKIKYILEGCIPLFS